MSPETPVTAATTPVESIDHEWDRFAASAPGGDLVQASAWALTKLDLGATAHAVSLRQQGHLAAGALVHLRSVAPMLKVATVAKGPLLAADQGHLTTAICDEVIRSARRLGAHVLVIQPPEAGWATDEHLGRAGFKTGVPAIAPAATSRLDLQKSDDELLADMSSMRRRNIRATDRASIAIEFETDVADFHALHTASALRQGFQPLALSTLESQWRHLGHSNTAAILVARHEGRPVAGLWLTAFGGTVTYKLPGWDPDLPQPKNVNEALHWHAIKWARSIGADIYDFGGFDREAALRATAGEAMPAGFEKTPSHFKAGFGGEVVVLPPARFSILLPIGGRLASSVGARAMSNRSAHSWISRFRNQ